MAYLRLDLAARRARPTVVRAVEVDAETIREGRAPAGPLALVLANDANLEAVADLLPSVDAVALHFPAFTDGRAYSQARLLRTRHGFQGDIIARGESLRDQALFMARCGVSLVEGDASLEEAFTSALAEFSAFYQNAEEAASSIHALRALRRSSSGRSAA